MLKRNLYFLFIYFINYINCIYNKLHVTNAFIGMLCNYKYTYMYFYKQLIFKSRYLFL